MSLYPAGNGTVKKTHYCPCECAPPAVTIMSASRSANSPGVSDSKYSDTLTALEAQAYSDYAGGGPVASKTTSYTDGPSLPDHPTDDASVENATHVNESTDPYFPPVGDDDPPDSTPHDALQVSLSESKYKFVLTWPGGAGGVFPFEDTNFKIKWRQRTAHYQSSTTIRTDYHFASDSITTTEVSFSESGAVTFTGDLEATVAFAHGATSAESDEFYLAIDEVGVGDTVSVIGPEELGKYLLAAVGGSGAPQGEWTLEVVAAYAEGYKNGFAPYTLDAPADGAIPLYAVETASAAAGSGASFGGAQTVREDHRVTDGTGGGLDTTFTPADAPEYVNASLTELAPSPGPDARLQTASELAAARVRYPGGLILALSDEIPTSALTTFVSGALDAVHLEDETAPDGSGVLTERYLAPSEFLLRAKKCRYRARLNLRVDPGVTGRTTLWSAADTVQMAVTTTTTNLDTGAKIASETTFSFSFDVGVDALGPDHNGYLGAGQYLYLGSWVEVAAPGTNTRVTWGDPRIKTASMSCWASEPIAEFVPA